MSRIKGAKRFFAAALSLVMAGCAPAETAQAGAESFTPPGPPKYATTTVTRGDYSYTPTMGSMGWSAWTAEEPVYYNDREGMRIAEFPVAQDKVVQKGDLLLHLTSEEGETALMELSKELSLLEGEYALEKGKKEREIAELEKDLSKHRYYEEELSLRQAKLQKLKVEQQLYIYEKEREIRLKKAAIEEQREKTGDITWYAPSEGKVYLFPEAEQLKEGEKMPVNTPVMILYPLEEEIFSVIIKVQEEGQPAKRVYYGMQAEVIVSPKDDLSGQISYQGQVVSISDWGNGMGKMARVMITDPACEGFSSVNQVKLAPIEEKDVLIADRGALRMQDGQYWVTVLSDGVEQQRRVLVGAMDMEKFVILEGVEEGQQLLLR